MPNPTFAGFSDDPINTARSPAAGSQAAPGTAPASVRPGAPAPRGAVPRPVQTFVGFDDSATAAQVTPEAAIPTKPSAGLGDIASDVWTAAKNAPNSFRAAWAQLTEAPGADVEAIYGNQNWRDRFIEEARQDAEKSAVRDDAGDTVFDFAGFKLDRHGLRTMPQSLAFSSMAMLTGFLGGIAGSPGGPKGMWAGLAMGSYMGAYNSDANMFIRQVRDSMDAESIRQRGRPLTDAEYIDIGKDPDMQEAAKRIGLLWGGSGSLEKIARAHAHHEAFWEAAGNTGLTVAGKLLLRFWAKKSFAKAAGAAAAGIGADVLTEVPTGVGQSQAEVEAGVKPGPAPSFTSWDDLKTSFNEVAGPALAQSVFMLASAAAAGRALDMMPGAKEPIIPGSRAPGAQPAAPPAPPTAAPAEPTTLTEVEGQVPAKSLPKLEGVPPEAPRAELERRAGKPAREIPLPKIDRGMAAAPDAEAESFARAQRDVEGALVSAEAPKPRTLDESWTAVKEPGELPEDMASDPAYLTAKRLFDGGYIGTQKEYREVVERISRGESPANVAAEVAAKVNPDVLAIRRESRKLIDEAGRVLPETGTYQPELGILAARRAPEVDERQLALPLEGERRDRGEQGRLPGEVGVGKEPVQAGPEQAPGAATPQAGGVVQGPQAGAVERELAVPAKAVDEAAAEAKGEAATPAQQEAGNYPKGHETIGGMPVTFENQAGSRRRPEWPPLKSHYGYFKGTEAADIDPKTGKREKLDVFVRPGLATDYSGPVFVIDQAKADGSFDEHKVMFGWPGRAEARAAYQENYTPDWTRGKAITAFENVEAFRTWMGEPANLKRPASPSFRIAEEAAALKAGRDKARAELEAAAKERQSDKAKAAAAEAKRMADKMAAEQAAKDATEAAEGARRMAEEAARATRAAEKEGAAVARAEAQRVSAERKEKAEHERLVKRAVPKLTLNEQIAAKAMPNLAEVADEPLFNDIVGSYLAGRLTEQRKNAETAGDKVFTDAVDAVLVDGKVNFPDDFYPPIQREAKRLAKEAAAAAKVQEQTRKLENTGAELRRWFDKAKSDIKNATGSAENVLAEIEANTARADLFRDLAAEDATPGTHRFIDEVRNAALTFAQFVTEGTGPNYKNPIRKFAITRESGYKAGSYRKEGPRAALLDFLKGEGVGRELVQDKSGEWQSSRLSNVEPSRAQEYVKAQAELYIEIVSEIAERMRGSKSVAEASVKFTEPLLGRQREFTELGERANAVIYDPVYHFGPESYGVRSLKRNESEKSQEKQPLIPPRLDRVTREGLRDYRQGVDVTPQMLKDEFGFKDVGFGKWVNVKRDQAHLNAAFDAFKDLAAVLGFPDKAIGQLDLYFTIGALGQGKAAAHYTSEQPHPDGGKVAVINLTNTRGDGTVSHEWAHGLDYALRATRAMKDNPQHVAVQQIVRALRASWDLDILNKDVERLLTGGIRYQSGELRTNKAAALRYYMRTHASSKKTDFQKHAVALDGGKSDPYWSNDEEMFARAWEGFVGDLLGKTRSVVGEEGPLRPAINNYLVNPAWSGDGRVKPPMYRGMPYPAGAERQRFATYFAALIKSLRWDDAKGFSVDAAAWEEARPKEQEAFEAAKKHYSDQADELLRLVEQERTAALQAKDQARQYELEEVRRRAEEARLAEEARNAPPPEQPQNAVLLDDEIDKLIDESIARTEEKKQEKPKEDVADAVRATDTARADAVKKTAGEIAAKAATEGVKGLDETMAGLVELFGGNALKSFPAGLDKETYAKAKPHFQKALEHFQAAGKAIKDFIDFIVTNFGAGIKPYLAFFIKEKNLTAGLGEQKKTSSSMRVAEVVAELLKTGKPFDERVLYSSMEMEFGGTAAEGKFTPKDAYDAMEMGVNLYVRSKRMSPTLQVALAVGDIAGLVRLVEQLPTQTRRTGETDEFQQFSTPPAYAYLVNWLANIKSGDQVLEPSAGVGGLAIFAEQAGGRLILNEYSARRAALLREMFPGRPMFTEDAAQLHNILPDDIRPGVVVMNPPFSSTAGRIEGHRDSAEGLQHISQALLMLADGGRLVAIMGEGINAPSRAAWWADVRKKYTVRANVTVSRDVYRKYGTTFPTVLVVIDKVGPHQGTTVTGDIAKLTDAPATLVNVRDSRGVAVEGQAPTTPVAPPADPIEQDKLPAPVEPAAPAEKSDVKIERAEIERALGAISDALYDPYSPQKVRVEGALPHAGKLVQSASMAAVEPPDPTHTPNLPEKTIKGFTIEVDGETIRGGISLAQLEAVVYAGQAHEQFLPGNIRRGFLIGDGTGVGKGREISAIILDNMRRGRKRAVWFSEKQTLVNDARRDFRDVGGDEKQIFNLTTEYEAGMPVRHKAGVLFSTYDTLRSGYQPIGRKPKKEKPGDEKLTPAEQAKAEAKKLAALQKKARIDQIVQWLGEDFDGVIVFDEAHNMANVLPEEGGMFGGDASLKAMAGLDLQKRMPQARILYVSATAATEVRNLVYGSRLGLWGEGTPFAGPANFVAEVEKGGVAVMEMVAQNLKALGLYIARSLSFDGVQHDTITHDLSEVQHDIYNEFARVWQGVLQNINEALNVTKATGSRAAAMKRSVFWAAHQRFFNSVLTSFAMPSVIEDAQKQLAAGHSPVFQLVSTGEAATERAVAKAEAAGEDLNDLDVTPMDSLIEFIMNAFPVQQFETTIGENGKPVQTPVYGSDGNSVINKEAQKMRDDLVKHLETIRQANPVPNPIDMVIEAFGEDNVSEITGRSRRFVRVRDEEGNYRMREEKRTDKMLSSDVKDFHNGKRQVLVFSNKGGTGVSYHASNTIKNKARRYHYLIQPGWRADQALQGFGRTHRTNQANAPFYKLVTTNVQAQKRFISSIARRLDQLGALTMGERRTGGRGLFSSEDNLESKYAVDALQVFFTDLNQGRTPFQIKALLTELGLAEKMNKDTGSINSQQVPITQFLNRLLSLTIERQNQVFEEYFARLDEIVENAKAQGTYDMGVEVIKALETKIERDEVAHRDERTKAEAKYVELELTLPQHFTSFENAKGQLYSMHDKAAGYFILRHHSKPDRVVALIDRGQRMNTKGQLVRRGLIIPVSGTPKYSDAIHDFGEAAEAEKGHSSKSVIRKIQGEKFEGGHMEEPFETSSGYVRRVGTGQISRVLDEKGREGVEAMLNEPGHDAGYRAAARKLWGRMQEYIKPGEVDRHFPRVSRIGGKKPSDADVPAVRAWLDNGPARILWEEETERTSPTYADRLHLITGAILPVWDRIHGHPRVVRTQTSDGRRLLGRAIHPKDLAATLKALGVASAAQNMPAAKIMERVLAGDRAILANGWELTMSRVSGEPRVEIKGPPSFLYGETKSLLKSQGVILERHGFSERAFVPVGDAAVLERITKGRPVVDLIQKGAEDANARTPGAPREPADDIDFALRFASDPRHVLEPDHESPRAPAELIDSLGRDLDRIAGLKPGASPPGTYMTAPLAVGIKEIARAMGVGGQVFGISTHNAPITINGARHGGNIFLNEASDSPHLHTFGHEFEHLIEREAPDVHKWFISELAKYVSQERYLEFIAKYGPRYFKGVLDAQTGELRPMTPDEAREYFKNNPTARGVLHSEFTAEIMGDSMMQQEFWDYLGSRNPSMLQRVLVFLRRLVEQIRRAFGDESPRSMDYYFKDFDRVVQLAAEAAHRFQQRKAWLGGETLTQDQVSEVIDTLPAEIVERALAGAIVQTQLQRPTTTVAPSLGDRARNVVRTIENIFEPLGKLPGISEFQKRRNLAQGAISAISDAGKDLHAVFTEATEADAAASFRYLITKGAATTVIVDPKIRAHAVKVKGMLEGVGEQLVKAGMLKRETFEKRRGGYLPQLYLHSILSESDYSQLGTGKKPSKLGYLKARGYEWGFDGDGELRIVERKTGRPVSEDWITRHGPITDPGYLTAVGFTRAMRDLALLDWFNDISRNREWAMEKSLVQWEGHRVTPYWLLSEAADLRARASKTGPDFANRVKVLDLAGRMEEVANRAIGEITVSSEWMQLPNTRRYGRLRGMVVRREIYDDIVGVAHIVPSDASLPEKIFSYGGVGSKVTGVWKLVKVPLNPTSQIRNFVANMVLLNLSGMSWVRIAQRIGQAAKEMRTGGRHYQLFKQRGGSANTFAANELYQIETEMLDLRAKASGPMSLMHFAAVGAKIVKGAGDFYQGVEALGKLAKFIHEQESNEASADDAMLEANKWLFDYSQVGKTLRWARRAPIGAPFLTFTIKVLPRIVETMLLHPQRMIPYVALAWGLPYAIAALTGVDPDDQEELKKRLPEHWQRKGHVYMLPFKDATGRWQFVDVSYYLPWSMWQEAIHELKNAELTQAAKSLGLLSGPIPDLMIAAATGKDQFTGRDIAPAGAPPDIQWLARLTYVMDMALPPIISSHGFVGIDLGDPVSWISGKLTDALKESTARGGEQRTTVGQAVAGALGATTRGVGEADLGARIRQMRFEVNETRKELRRQLADQSLTPAQREKLTLKYTDEIMRRQQKITELVGKESAAEAR